ncbi:hypothetical protein HK103_004612 [Boothiomyces macroporosus]|uniref:Uncharacterized protein n=1 Tax=Boothiomyces macroporosus TaxID=261099 RepID=A0AAD5Y5R0_9FUNG|nr:hypothetical protein HK103_004612 [Boothiomyces macroporosus]KAJ3314647.1 hypothetical protein HDV04_005653 [Boothiomyces sp. JEL0838]
MSELTLFQKYQQSLQTNPVQTKAATSGILYGLQELIALTVTKTADSKGLVKALKMILYGFFVSGPLGHYMYLELEKRFQGKVGAVASIGKLLASNLIISPILNFLYLFALAGIAGANAKQALGIAQSRILGLMKISWVVFPLVQTFAFKNLPPELWLPFFNFVAFVFGTYINIKTKLANKKKEIKK